MEYKLLSKIFYADKENYEKECLDRKSSPFSTKLGFNIGGEEAFYVNLPGFSNQISKLYKNFSELQKIEKSLPRVAYDQYARKCLVDEIMLTNDIEGIRSTRKEIIDVIESDHTVKTQSRFDGLVKKYMKLLYTGKAENIELNSCMDIRELYDEIVLDEIDESEHPDGEIFRKDGADVISGTQQVKHTGVNPEAKIIEYMNQGLQLLKNDNIPPVFRIAIFHYLIGYVHPFYNGNGRLSRFISSGFIKDEFDALVALRLSYTIKNTKTDYYKAFDVCNDSKNQGDITYFLIYFMETINSSISSLKERLSEGDDAIRYYHSLLQENYQLEDTNKGHKQKDLLWYLILNRLFAVERFSKKDIAQLLEITELTADNYIKDSIAKGVPIKIEKDGRKNIYTIDLDEAEHFLTEE